MGPRARHGLADPDTTAATARGSVPLLQLSEGEFGCPDLFGDLGVELAALGEELRPVFLPGGGE
jgi:hypothetical protein